MLNFQILQTAIDVEYLRLLYAIHSSDIVHHLYRGYTILNKDLTKSPVKEIQVTYIHSLYTHFW